MLVKVLKQLYSIHYRSNVDIVVYKNTIGILLNGEFVIFLSRKYIQSIFSLTQINYDNLNSTTELTKSEIISLVKRERLTRTKINCYYQDFTDSSMD